MLEIKQDFIKQGEQSNKCSNKIEEQNENIYQKSECKIVSTEEKKTYDKNKNQPQINGEKDIQSSSQKTNIPNLYIGTLYINKPKKIKVDQLYSSNEKMFTIKKYIDNKEEWENEVDILNKLKETDITLKFISSGIEDERYYFEQICGLKDLKRLKQDFMPYILNENELCLRYDAFISILFIILIQKLIRLHELGYAHSDIKPQNIVIGFDYEPYFIDLGGAVSLKNPTNYLSSYTKNYVLKRHLLNKQKDEFKNKEQVICCEFSQLSITIIQMLIPELQDAQTLFTKQQFQELISKNCKQFPYTKKLLEIVFNEQLQNQSSQMNFQELKKIKEQIHIDIDYEQLSQTMMNISDIQYNSISNEFKIKRINKGNINIINLIQTEFQNINISPSQVQIEPYEENSVFQKIMNKYNITPFQDISKCNQDFENNSILNLKKWIKSSQSKNQTFNIGISSEGNMNMLLEGLQQAKNYYNIRICVNIINDKLSILFLKKREKYLNNFQIEKINIFNISEHIFVVHLKQINSERVEQVLSQQNEIKQHQKEIILEDVTIKKCDKTTKNSLQQQNENANIQINQFSINEDIINIYLKHQIKIDSNKMLSYSLLKGIYELKQPLNINVEISGQKRCFKEYLKNIEQSLKKFIKKSQIIQKEYKIFPIVTISIKNNLKNRFRIINIKNSLKKDPLNVYKELKQDRDINQDTINQIDEKNINNLVVLQNIENKFMNQNDFQNIFTKLNDQIIQIMDYLLDQNQNYLCLQLSKLTIIFNQLLISKEIYNIITFYQNKYKDTQYIIDIVFIDCIYDLEFFKVIMKLRNCSIEYFFEEKTIEEQLNQIFTIQFNNYNLNEQSQRKKIKILFIKPIYNDYINNQESLNPQSPIQNQDLEIKNYKIEKNNIIKMFSFNESYVNQILQKAQYLKVLKTQSSEHQISYFFFNQKALSIVYSKKNLDKELFQIKNIFPELKYRANSLQYDIMITNKTAKRHQEQQRVDFQIKYIDHFTNDVFKILLQTMLFKQDRDSQIFMEQIKQILEFTLLNKFKQIMLSQDAHQMEFIYKNESIKLSSIKVFINTLKQFLSLNCVKPISQLYIQFVSTIISEEQDDMSEQEELDRIEIDKMNIELIVIDISSCEIENQNCEKYLYFISSIRGINIYIYLPRILTCTLSVLQEIISRKQKAKKLLLDIQKNENKELIYSLLSWILMQNLKNRITLRIQTIKKTHETILNQFYSFFQSPNCQKPINNNNFKQNVFDEILISINGTNPSNDLECDIQIKCDGKNILFPQSIHHQINKEEKNNIYNQNTKFPPLFITYEERKKIVPQKMKNFMAIPLSFNQIESDLQNFIDLNNQNFNETYKLQSDQFQNDQLQEQKNQDNSQMRSNGDQIKNQIETNKNNNDQNKKKERGNKKNQKPINNKLKKEKDQKEIDKYTEKNKIQKTGILSSFEYFNYLEKINRQN